MSRQGFLVLSVSVLCACILCFTACAPGDQDNQTTHVDALGITFVSIPAGSFEMGCSPDDTVCFPDELPRHTVDISSFWMSAYEITQQQWETVMGNNPSGFSPCPQCPIESVSWEDVQEFIDALSLITGVSYRLPTEAEWEYAARAGTITRYYCGNEKTCLDRTAWYSDSANGQTHEVGQKEPNSWGLYDMHGNVWEYCLDWYDPDYYAESQVADPRGPDTGVYRTVRGGAWNAGADNCRVSYRLVIPFADSGLGFRLCMDDEGQLPAE